MQTWPDFTAYSRTSAILARSCNKPQVYWPTFQLQMDSWPVDEGATASGLGGLDQVSDPVQKMMLMQLQQNSMLIQKLLKPRDTMSSLLTAGSGSESGSSSTGARGCVARELFLKTVEDLVRVGELTRNNALRELGIPPEKETGFLMKEYLEKRVPLQDHKLLSHVAALLAEGWNIAFKSDNLEMRGFLSRMLIFVEQTALDAGKLELAYLLTGYTEPNSHLFFPLRKTPGLKPFSRLADPLWLSANLAYLRDLDYLQSRTSSLGKANPRPAKDPDAEDRPKAKPKAKKQPGRAMQPLRAERRPLEHDDSQWQSIRCRW